MSTGFFLDFLLLFLIPEKNLLISTATKGTKDSPATIFQPSSVSVAVLNIPERVGMQMTETCIIVHIIKDITNFGFVKNPIENSDPLLRTLKECTSWDKLSTAKVHVRAVA